ncbi:MAG TPA: thioredoxin family protein [Bacteroidetes bacterium]|nr:thioredoxin family protein [Bacteroidota bacterium]
MLIHEIKILCPGRKCSKCRRMISRVEEALSISGIEMDIKMVDTLDELLKYHTWVLPALVINNRMVARGYVPSVQIILKYLNDQNNR